MTRTKPGRALALPTAAQRAALAEVAGALRALPSDRRLAFAALPAPMLDTMTDPGPDPKQPTTAQRRSALRALVLELPEGEAPALRSLQSKLAHRGWRVPERTIAADLEHLRGRGKLGPVRAEPLPRPLTEDPTVSAMKLEAISKAYGLSVRTLLRYVQAGELKASRVGRGYLVTVANLRAWLESRAAGGSDLEAS